MTFNPDVALLMDQLRALAGQVAECVVVDNHSDNIGAWKADAESYSALIALPVNSGIGVAQNIGIRHALSKGATHILLLDHDSVPDPGMVDALLRADEALGAAVEDLAAVGPLHIDGRNGCQSSFMEAKAGLRQQGAVEPLREVDFLISSGILIRSAALTSIGLMNERFFIDHVDTEWCLKARSQGYRIFGVPSASLRHHLGDYVIRVWFGRWRNVSVHSPARNYYMSRNTCLMLRSAEISFQWRLKLGIRLLQHLLFFSFVVTPRCDRVSHMLLGIWHGIRGVTGPLRG